MVIAGRMNEEVRERRLLRDHDEGSQEQSGA